MKPSQYIGLIVALLILVFMNFIPESELLSRSGINTIGILIAVLILFITEPIHIGLTCLISIPLLVIFRAAPNVPAALKGYTNSIVFFVLASFGVSHALVKVPLSNRLLRILIGSFGKNVRLILLAFMVTSAVLSSVISNVATTAVFIPIILTFLGIYKKEEDRRRTGKAFMIGLPVASMIGGMITPAGSSLNLMTLSFLEDLTGTTVSFAHWMAIGIPVVIVMLPIAWYIIHKVYGVVELGEEEIRQFVDGLDVPRRMEGREVYVLVIMVGMFIFWLLSSWYPVFDITVVMMVGFALLFVPGFPILAWDEFVASVSWPAFFLLGSIITIGNRLIENGVSDWLVATVFPGTIDLPLVGVAFLIAILVFLLLIVVPVAPALIPLLSVPLVGLAKNMGIPPAVPIMVMGLTVSNCYLLPLDTVPLITYMTGYYKMLDMPKSTAFIQLIMSGVVAVLVPLTMKVLGYF
ncbi:MAG: sodium:sulfate symporter [Firmicutes bacterium]|nr:sodium:sulfate symporter [Bacillota bacterium]